MLKTGRGLSQKYFKSKAEKHTLGCVFFMGEKECVKRWGLFFFV